MLQTIPEILEDAQISLYLAVLDEQKGNLFPRPVNRQAAEVIYTEFKSVQWAYNQDNNYDGIIATSNYLYWLCAQYNLRAIFIRTHSGGGIPVNPSNPSIISPTPLEFIVSGVSPIPTGSDSITITAYIGYNLIFSRNNSIQTMVNNNNTYYVWNKATGFFQCIGVAAAGEEFSITPVI
jgi:hypothetical protein